MIQFTFFQRKSNKKLLLCILLLFLFSITIYSPTFLHATEMSPISSEPIPFPTEDSTTQPEITDSLAPNIPEILPTESPVFSEEPATESIVEASKEEYVVESFEGTYYVTSSGGLNIRSGPSIQYDIIGNLPYGEQISVTGKVQNDWFEIFFQETHGYISAKYLSKDQPSTIALETEELSETIESITEESAHELDKTPYVSDTTIILLLFAIASMIIIIIITVISFFHNNHNY